MREEEKIDAGLLFDPSDPELRAIKRKTHDLNTEYNATLEGETERRAEILGEILGEFGEGGFIQGPIFFHYGKHTKIGKRFFGNFNLTVQDDARVTIGDCCNFGPNTTIVTPLHPMIAEKRNAFTLPNGETKRLCYAKPVKIGNNCWFGAGVTVCPGVTVGDNCVIGSSVQSYTRDIGKRQSEVQARAYAVRRCAAIQRFVFPIGRRNDSLRSTDARCWLGL